MTMSLRAKLIGGFSFVAFIALVIGVIGWWGVSSLASHLKDIADVRMLRVESLMVMDKQFQGVISAQRGMLNQDLTQEGRDKLRAELQDHREALAAAKKKYEDTLTTADEKAKLQQFGESILSWRAETNKFTDDLKALETIGMTNPLIIQRDINIMISEYRKLSLAASMLILNKAKIEGGEDYTESPLWKWINKEEFAKSSIHGDMVQLIEPCKRYHAAIAKIKAAADTATAQRVYLDELRPEGAQIVSQLEKLVKVADDARITVRRMINQATVVAEAKQDSTVTLLNAIVKENLDATETAKAESKTAANLALTLTGFAVAIGVIAALLLGFIIATTVTRSLNRVIDGLNSSSDQVSAAADQVSSAGQDLAQGASEQASSLEETSASLEEMNSMTKQNAENAYNADSMSKATTSATEGGVKAMEKMSEAIGKIKASSDETAKIIKTIDEIAFQTNLLALNAAVEAARAGEAGKGFAVVAEEVRNLAQRSAEAAKNTSALIEGSQSNSEEGVRVAKEVGESLAKINGNVGKVGALISEISAASGEQAKGIDQINRAVAEMDKLTQQNASNSEESASAAEELSAQAGELKSMVGQLVGIVTGTVAESRVADLRRPPRRPQAPAARRQLAPPSSAKSERKATAAPAKRISESQAEKVIPLDDDDFKDF